MVRRFVPEPEVITPEMSLKGRLPADVSPLNSPRGSPKRSARPKDITLKPLNSLKL